MRPYENLCILNMPGKLIQTTVDTVVLRKFDALAKVQGHKRASYLRHLVEMHVRALTPALSKITGATSPLDNVTPMQLRQIQIRARIKNRHDRRQLEERNRAAARKCLENRTAKPRDRRK